MKKIPIILLTCFCSYLSAQFPGGVQGVSSWVMPELFEDQRVELWEKTGTTFLGLQNNLTFMNYNPALSLSPEIDVEKIALGKKDLSQLQVFSVYLPQDTIQEKAVWCISSANQDALLLTTHRLADLQEGRFINNLGDKKNQAQINTYQRFLNKSTSESYHVSLGKKGWKQSIPIQNFTGKFAELIIYDRVLSSIQKAQVETYLALKYGLGLDASSGQSMYNSLGDKIWDAQKNAKYSTHVAGIGRDEGGNLYQKQSGSVHFDNIFSLALNEFSDHNLTHPGQLSDQQYLIWGATTADLRLENKIPGQVQKINKHWQLKQINFTAEQTQLRFQVSDLPFEKKAEEIYWLVIDRSGSGDFSPEHTSYIAQDDSAIEDIAQFSAISWGANGKHLFTIAVGPKLIPKLWVAAANCDEPNPGTFEIGAEGGLPPYHFSLLHLSSHKKQEWQSSDASTRFIHSAAAGQYELSIRDSEGNHYQESFYINPADALVSQLDNEYLLPANGSLPLDASLGLDSPNAIYTWTLPNGSTAHGAQITIKQTGSYLLNILEGDCLSQQEITIKGTLVQNIKSVDLFPNPTSGYFELLITLHQPSPVLVQLYDPAGRMIKSVQLDGAQRYRYQENMAQTGFYFMRITSQEQSQTLKLAVHH